MRHWDVADGAPPEDGDNNVNRGFFSREPPDDDNWSRRYIHNVEMLRSGDITNVALVAHRLEARAHEKGLSAGEQRMLDRARNILECEALLGLPDGGEDEDPGEGGSGVREPRRPRPTGDAGPEAMTPPTEPADREDRPGRR